MAQALGIHILLELYDCPQELLRDPIDSRRILLAAATAMGARIVEERFHAFRRTASVGWW